MRFRFRVLPALIFVGAMMLTIRVGDIWQGFAALEGGISVPPALGAGKQGSAPENVLPKAGKKAMAETTPGKTAAAQAPEKDLPDPDQMSRSEIKLLQQLSTRRDLLERRARHLASREALLKAAEQKLVDQQADLVAIRAELKRLLGELNNKERKRIANLVKIYETMKPKSAAKIFNELEMEVLLGVVEQMKVRKVAPVIAAMVPDRARQVTQALARRQKGATATAGLPPPAPNPN